MYVCCVCVFIYMFVCLCACVLVCFHLRPAWTSDHLSIYGMVLVCFHLRPAWTSDHLSIYGMVWYGMVWHHACNVRQTEHLASNRVSDATPHIACRRCITRDGGRERERERERQIEREREREKERERESERVTSREWFKVQGPRSVVQARSSVRFKVLRPRSKMSALPFDPWRIRYNVLTMGQFCDWCMGLKACLLSNPNAYHYHRFLIIHGMIVSKNPQMRCIRIDIAMDNFMVSGHRWAMGVGRRMWFNLKVA